MAQMIRPHPTMPHLACRCVLALPADSIAYCRLVALGQGNLIIQDKATNFSQEGTATAFGQGPHPDDKNADTSNVSMPNIRGGPQQEDLDGEQMAAPGEGEVMNAQLVFPLSITQYKIPVTNLCMKAVLTEEMPSLFHRF